MKIAVQSEDFDLNFELYSKPEGVENERYLELCQKRSLKFQTNADLVVHYEKAHELVNLIVCCYYLFTLFSKKKCCSVFLFETTTHVEKGFHDIVLGYGRRKPHPS